MTTKEQERKVLAQIKKLVESLGENSYVGTAFEGCFEKAEENIEYDAAFSWKGEAELAMEKASKLELDNRDLRLAVKKAKEDASSEITALQNKIEDLKEQIINIDDLEDCIGLIDNKVFELTEVAQAAASKIVAYADDPSSEEFKKAVRDNRNAADNCEYYKGILGRLRQTKNARV